MQLVLWIYAQSSKNYFWPQNLMKLTKSQKLFSINFSPNQPTLSTNCCLYLANFAAITTISVGHIYLWLCVSLNGRNNRRRYETARCGNLLVV